MQATAILLNSLMALLVYVAAFVGLTKLGMPDQLAMLVSVFLAVVAFITGLGVLVLGRGA